MFFRRDGVYVCCLTQSVLEVELRNIGISIELNVVFLKQ